LQVHEGAAVDDGQVRLAVDVGAGLVVEAWGVEVSESLFEFGVELLQSAGDAGGVVAGCVDQVVEPLPLAFE
jgi:hypothetical protein